MNKVLNKKRAKKKNKKHINKKKSKVKVKSKRAGSFSISQIENEYGFDDRVRVVEYVMSKSKDGYNAYPSFEIVENNEEGG